MISFSQTAGYAVLALGRLEGSGDTWVRSSEINACTGVPMPYLRRILHLLGKTGLVETKRGYRGGFRLGRRAEEICLRDIVTAVENPKRKSDCLMGLPVCSDDSPCPLHQYWQEVKVDIERHLCSVSVKEAAEYVQNSRHTLRSCGRADESRTQATSS